MTEAQGTTIEWSAPGGPLGELTLAAAERAAALHASARSLEAAAAAAPAPPSFARALRREQVAVIAEIKRRSPSKGVLDSALDAPGRASAYASGGAAAISVLTEPSHFGGSLDDLRAVREVVRVPLLRKDFLVDALQLCEARAAGAAAVLLIARAMPAARFAALANEARALGLDVLLEVRDERELERALRVDGAVIGINNRNLETLVIDHAVSERLLPRVPGGRIAVYESGVGDRAAVERAAALGADAVLVGSALSASADGERAVRALTGVPRRPRER